MIHGFGATGSIFAKMVKDLRKKFSVTTIDLLGMGFSGRPAFNL
jgi:pimeloyl-ACP methyl ester carboxylesterase